MASLHFAGKAARIFQQNKTFSPNQVFSEINADLTSGALSLSVDLIKFPTPTKLVFKASLQ